MFDSKKLALLGTLAALNSVVRLLGAGVAGIETAFALIIIAGYVLGARFGLALGALSITTSAFMSGGVGPWLPFQIAAAAVVGFGAGLLPKSTKLKLQKLAMSLYAVFAAYLYGALMTLWTWPLIAGNTVLGFKAGDGPLTNLLRFLNYELVSGGLLWDTGRAITTVTLIALTASTLTTTLERAATRVEVKVEL
jgi:energy-coupling factor transport system substrate-specific component